MRIFKGSIGGTGGGTIGGTIAPTQVAFGSGVNTISGSADLVWDDGLKILNINGKLTVSGAIDPTSLTLSGTSLNTFIDMSNGNLVPVSPANEGRIRYNSTSQSFEVSENGGAWTDLSVGGNAFIQGGNSFGATAILGTNDAQDLEVITNGTGKAIFNVAGQFGIGTLSPSQTLDVNGNAIVRQHFASGANSSIDDGSLIYPGFLFSVIASLEESTTVNNIDFVQAQLGYLELNPPADATYEAFSLDGEVKTSAACAFNFPLINGTFSNVLHYGTGIISQGIGTFSTVELFSSGSISRAYASLNGILNNSTGTINNSYAIYANTAFNGGGGAIINNYGLFLEDQSGVGTSNFNLWSDGSSSLNIFIGSVGVKTSTPAHPLDVIGIIGCSDKVDFGAGIGTATVNSRFSIGIDNSQLFVSAFPNGSGFHVRGNGVDVLKIRQQPTVEITQIARVGGGAAWVLKGTGASHSGLSSGVENNDVYFNLNRTVQFSSGLLTLNRAFWIDPNVTYSFTAASTITDAVGLAISGLPMKGANATIARSTGAMFGAYGITGNSSSNFAVTVLQNGISAGIGSVSNQSALLVWNPIPVSLGDQTATVSDLASGYFGAITYTSTTNTRTVTRGSTVYIQGAPINGGNVSFSNGPYSLYVDDGPSRFDGRILGSSSGITAANDLILGTTNQNLVSGNTQINAITTSGWTAGSQITLIFSGTPTVKHNTAGGAGTARIFLSGSADFLAANNSVLELEYDGTQWQEISRKAA